MQETDLYRLEGNRLYYLNSYRGLMVFDVTNVDQPKFLGRSAIYGTPVDMIVNGGIATVVVGDWYGTLDNGSPVSRFDRAGARRDRPDEHQGRGRREARRLGAGGPRRRQRALRRERGLRLELRLGARRRGPRRRAGSWSVSGGGGASGPNVIVSSVDFAGGQVKQVASQTYAGYGGVFNVTPNSIMLAHPDDPDGDGGYVQPTKTDLVYLDISDPGGKIVQRGTLQVDGVVDTSGADEGRWGLDFADGKTAHVIGCASGQYGCGGTTGAYVLATGDFSNPDAPALDSELSIPATGWSVTARFDSEQDVPLAELRQLRRHDDAAAGLRPVEADGPGAGGPDAAAGDHLAHGAVRQPALRARQRPDGRTRRRWLSTTSTSRTPPSPSLIGTSTFGDGWASTPAAGTFKAFTMDSTRGLVVLPFSGWDASNSAYNNGVQLIEFTPDEHHHGRRRSHDRLGRARHLREQPHRVAERSGAIGRRLLEPARRRR